MRRTAVKAVFWVAMGLALPGVASQELPALAEIREILRKEVRDIPEAELEAVATQALLERVQGRLLAEGEVVNEEVDAPAVIEKRLIDPGCVYVRVGRVSLGLAPQLAAVLQDTNLITEARGLVLDLRFAGGVDYAGAANAADLLVGDDAPLLDWGDGVARGSVKTGGWTLPVAVLVNKETRGAAEALAAVLRSRNVGLLLGNPTAGTAAVFREVPLADGRRLRLATARVRTGDGAVLGIDGVQPDIMVRVTPQQEQAYLADPYTVVRDGNGPGGATNQVVTSVTVKRRVTEADLVRQRRSANEGVAVTNAVGTRVDPPVIRDPVLGRAVDLLKGLAVLRPASGA
jgi:hypothetical protein